MPWTVRCMGRLNYSMLTSLDGYTEDGAAASAGRPPGRAGALLSQPARVLARHLSLRAEDGRDDGLMGDGDEIPRISKRLRDHGSLDPVTKHGLRTPGDSASTDEERPGHARGPVRSGPSESWPQQYQNPRPEASVLEIQLLVQQQIQHLEIGDEERLVR